MRTEVNVRNKFPYINTNSRAPFSQLQLSFVGNKKLVLVHTTDVSTMLDIIIQKCSPHTMY